MARLRIVVLGLIVSAGVPGVALAQERERGEPLLNSRELRWEFRDVVSDVRESTVSILDDQGRQQALGVVVDEQGGILTKGSELKAPLEVRLADGRRFAAEYIGYHEPTDLALLRTRAERLSPIHWKPIDDPQVGQWLVTAGISSRPEAVGVVSVPRRAIPRQGAHGILGIEFHGDLEIPRVKRVFPDSGAAQAGLKPDDVILKIDDVAMSRREEVSRTIASHRPGDRITLQIERDGRRLVVPATLTHQFGDFLTRIALQNQMGGELSFRRDDFPGVLRQDGVVEPQDCGGPVVNLKREVVGLNIARAGRTETYILPVDLILPVLAELQTGQLPPPAGFGVSLEGTSAPPPALPELLP